jgi:translocation and assembly module TamA
MYHWSPSSPWSLLSIAGCFLLMWALASVLLPSQAGANAVADYEVDFEGIEDSSLMKMLKQASDAFERRKDPPPSRFLLRRRAESDRETFRDILRSQGYYDPRVAFDISRPEEEKAWRLTFSIDPGPIYRLSAVRFRLEPPLGATEPSLPQPESIGLQPGEPLLAASVRQARDRLARRIADQGFVFAEVDRPRLLVDHKAHSLKVEMVVHPGPKARFGEVAYVGLHSVDPEFLRQKIPWRQGAVYDPDLVQAYKRRLLATELFSFIQIHSADSLGESDRLPLTVELKEREHRTVSLGGFFDTDIGPGLRASWEHRNIFGQGEKLRFEGEGSRVRQELQTRYREDAFYRPDQSLNLLGSLAREETDTYTSLSFSSRGTVERELTQSLLAGAGLGYKGSSIEEQGDTETFHLFSLPMFLNFDNRNDVLDPRRGNAASLNVTPYRSLASQDLTFVKAVGTWRWYQALFFEDAPVLALRAKIGSLVGAATESIPADERFYAGGGGSIRGYPYQEVGPEDEGDPAGGRSLIEVSAEIRWKWTRSFGSAAFVDGGTVDDDPLPQWSNEHFSWGAGVGLRYFTGIGPLRLDVAFPLSNRDEVDSFQIYLSLGQAF